MLAWATEGPPHSAAARTVPHHHRMNSGCQPQYQVITAGTSANGASAGGPPPQSNRNPHCHASSTKAEMEPRDNGWETMDLKVSGGEGEAHRADIQAVLQARTDLFDFRPESQPTQLTADLVAQVLVAPPSPVLVNRLEHHFGQAPCREDPCVEESPQELLGAGCLACSQSRRCGVLPLTVDPTPGTLPVAAPVSHSNAEAGKLGEHPS